MNTIAQKIKGYVSTWVFILVVGLLSFNKIYYVHTHIESNGKIIIHSHPFNKSSDADPIKKHHHTNTDLLRIASLNILLLFMFFALGGVFCLILQVFNPQQEIPYDIACLLSQRGRGPPVS